MTGFESKRMAAMEIEVAELKNSLAQAKQKKTLRDEFAMTVLPGIAGYTADDMARLAYVVADAMMKERMK
jgi:hypothetical protein